MQAVPPLFVIAGVIAGSGLLIFLLCLPLVWRKVPRNHFYGIRLRASFASDQRWYDINAYGGRQFAIWSLLTVFAGVAGFFFPPKLLVAYAIGATGLVFVAVVAPIVLILLWIRRHPG